MTNILTPKISGRAFNKDEVSSYKSKRTKKNGNIYKAQKKYRVLLYQIVVPLYICLLQVTQAKLVRKQSIMLHRKERVSRECYTRDQEGARRKSAPSEVHLAHGPLLQHTVTSSPCAEDDYNLLIDTSLSRDIKCYKLSKCTIITRK